MSKGDKGKKQGAKIGIKTKLDKYSILNINLFPNIIPAQ